jgi:hypothetical protein
MSRFTARDYCTPVVWLSCARCVECSFASAQVCRHRTILRRLLAMLDELWTCVFSELTKVCVVIVLFNVGALRNKILCCTNISAVNRL